MSFLMILIGMILLCNQDPNLNCVGIILIIAGILRGLFGSGNKPETPDLPEASAEENSNYEI